MKFYLVGGAVRDSLLHLPEKDNDWLVIGATPEQLIKKGFTQVGSDFPVFLHPITKEEYALARTEKKINKGYSGFTTISDASVTIEDDLKRRDLTINAIAKDSDGKLIDPYGGIKDINHRILRHISESFIEDPLRVLRVARFAAQFHHLGFVIHPETLNMMKEIVHQGEIDYLTPERVWIETEKALQSENPQIYFKTLLICDALKILFPALNQLFLQKNDYFNEYLGEVSLVALNEIAQTTNDTSIRFAMLYALSQTKIEDFNAHSSAKIILPNIVKDWIKLTYGCFYKILNLNEERFENVINFFDFLNAWKYPERLAIILKIVNVYAFYSNYNDHDSLTRNVRKCYDTAKKINVSDIILDGFSGRNITLELCKRRIESLKISKF